MDSLDLPGCFAMTELGHGSNVAGIETTAHYDERGGEFVLNTPGNDASKYWIGGAGQHGKLSAVFAQLSVGGVPRGVHVFAVRIRDDAGGAVRGVEILDHGSKAGLNGVDNGQIWFRNLRVPRESLLNALADVSPEGEYSSPIPSAAARFGATVGGLTTGRVLIASAAVEGVKLAAVIALRYSARRPQFGDAIILDYLTHANRLAPALAAGYAYHLALGRLKALSGEIVFRSVLPRAAKRDQAQTRGKLGWENSRGLQSPLSHLRPLARKTKNTPQPPPPNPNPQTPDPTPKNTRASQRQGQGQRRPPAPLGRQGRPRAQLVPQSGRDLDARALPARRARVLRRDGLPRREPDRRLQGGPGRGRDVRGGQHGERGERFCWEQSEEGKGKGRKTRFF